jgi:NADH-quinone oxidoreductase subunit J
MDVLFYLHAVIAVTAMMIAMIVPQTIYALLFAVFSILNLSICLYVLSMPVAAAILAIIYAGAIMILFIFAVMLIKEEVKAKISAPNITFLLTIFITILFALDMSVFFYKTEWLNKPFNKPVDDLFFIFLDQHGFLLEMASFLLLAGLVASAFVSSPLLKKKEKS